MPKNQFLVYFYLQKKDNWVGGGGRSYCYSRQSTAFFFFTVITDPQRQPAWRKVKYRISMLALLHTALNHRNYQKMV